VSVRVGIELSLRAEPLRVDVAEGDDISQFGHVVGVARPLAADADAGEVQPIVRGQERTARPASLDENAKSGQGGGLEEMATMDAVTHLETLLEGLRTLRASSNPTVLPYGRA